MKQCIKCSGGKMTNRIFLFSDMYLPTFPMLEAKLYKTLEKMVGSENIAYVLQEGDIRLTDESLRTDIFSSSILNIKAIKEPKLLPSIMLNGDLLVMRFAYKLAGGEVAQAVRSAGHNILQYDPGGVDIRFRASPAQYITSKSESLKRAALKKFPKHYKHIFVTGSIHYDAAEQNKVDRDIFMNSYGLNPKKKLAVLTPANPGEAWMDGLQDDYRKIVDIIVHNCPGYEIVIKGHPLDYTASMKLQPGIIHKNEHYDGKHSWEKFAPGVKVIKAEEGYNALNACDVVLNIRSSLAIEIPLFAKPLININRHKYVTNWPFDPKVMIDIEIDDLANILNNNKYSVDSKACEEYCDRECYSNDGKAYERTADAAMKIFKGEI